LSISFFSNPKEERARSSLHEFFFSKQKKRFDFENKMYYFVQI